MIKELLGCLDLSLAFLSQQVADLSDEEMVLQPQGAPNNAVWTLGHIINSFQAVAMEFGASAWLADDWELRFGYGSTPNQCVSERFKKDMLLYTLTDSSAQLYAVLIGLDESELTKPMCNIFIRELIPTTGQLLMHVLVGHIGYHAGQLTAWRRAIGRAPVGVFV